ncbi:alpha/beta hydrolase [[Actinomadura] parvosata]|uniref:alpha/beta hydrolase n=1 Tax=[Actinomadura] parvosata TaxID=1955412 RepID=UPI00406CD73D
MPRNLAIAAGHILTGTLLMLLTLPSQPAEHLVRFYGSDLATADRVAIIVPGADTRVATFDSSTRHPGGAARALLAEAARLAPGERLAVVAWLGYDSPPTLSLGALTDHAAITGARELRRTVAALHRLTSAPIALLCHSYGSFVCARAAPGLPLADLAFIGSPGVGAAGPAPPLRVRVWAGLGDTDWIRLVPKVKLGHLGFGADPMNAAYGARRFEAGTGGHSDYYTPGTPSLRNLALISLGRDQEVIPDDDGS